MLEISLDYFCANNRIGLAGLLELTHDSPSHGLLFLSLFLYSYPALLKEKGGKSEGFSSVSASFFVFSRPINNVNRERNG